MFHFSAAENTRIILLTSQVFYELNEWVYVKCLEWDLTDSKCYMNASNYSSYVLEYFILSLFEKNLKDYNFLFTAVLVFSILKDKDYFLT